MKTLLTQQTAAARLGLSLPTFRSYRRKNVVSALGKLGEVFVFDEEEIERLKASLQPHKPFRSRIAETK